MLTVKVIYVVVFLNVVFCKDTIPVLLVDYQEILNNQLINSDPLKVTDTEHFSSLVRHCLKESEIILIFLEENFSQEDISTRDSLGTPFHHLRQSLIENKVKYIPSVMHPYETLTEMFQPKPFNVFYVTSLNFKTQNININNNKYLYIYFKDTEKELRTSVLRKHDLILREIYFMISEQSKRPVIAIYTGKKNPVEFENIYYSHRQSDTKKDPETDNILDPEPEVDIMTNRGRFYMKGLTFSLGRRRSSVIDTPEVSDESWTDKKMKTTLAYPDFKLQFSFDFTDYNWRLHNIAFISNGTEVAMADVEIAAPWGASYICGTPIIIRNSRNGRTVSISEYQIQAFEEPLQDSPDAIPTTEAPGKKVFAVTVKCTGSFTAGIISCLLISFLLLSVLIFGVMLMLNIGSNDRFDDFKKPYVFGSQTD